MSTFRTLVEVQLWPSRDFDLTSTVPSFTWKGEEVDIDYALRLTKDRKELEITLWNIGEPERVSHIFREGFLIALDLARIDTPGTPVVGRLHRTVLARIKGLKVGEDAGEAGDLPFKVTAIPIQESLRETIIRAHFGAESGPYYLVDVVKALLEKGGVGAVQVDIPREFRLDNFTCDDPIWTAIKRAAAKAGTAVGIWLQGGAVRVSTRFVGLTILDDDDILDAGREEQGTTQSVQPIVPEEFQIAGESFSLPEQYAGDTEEAQIALDEAPANIGYKLEILPSPELFEGGSITVTGKYALNKMGFYATALQSFNILGLEHIGSSYSPENMDTTFLYVALRTESETEET